MNILFVCKGNRFRSKVAEAVFNKLNKDRRHKARSAGIIKGRPVASIVKKCARKLGYTIKGSPRTIDISLLKWQDRIIIVADEIPPTIFEGIDNLVKDIIVWKIPDSMSTNENELTNIMVKIEKKVKDLVNKSERKH